MADAKLSQLTARESNVGDPFNDLLYYVVAAGATDADKQRKTTPADLMINAFRTMSWVWEDYIVGNGMFFRGGNNGGGEGQDNSAESNHIGVWNFNTGSSSNGGGGSFTNIFGMAFRGGALRVMGIFKTPDTLSNGTDRYGIAFGLCQNLWDINATDAMFVRYRDNLNSGKWQVYGSVGGSSTTDTGVTVAASTWYRITMDFNTDCTALNVDINGTTVGPITTNLPDSFSRMALLTQIVKETGTNERAISLDAMGYIKHFTTPR